MKKLLQDSIIEEFVGFLGKNSYLGLHIIDWPDKRNRTIPDIDAIAVNTTKKIAIEHTSIDSLENQRRNTDWFKKAVGCLKLELEGEISCRLSLSVPYTGVQKVFLIG